MQGYAGLKERAVKIPSEEQCRLTSALERLAQLYGAWCTLNSRNGVTKLSTVMPRFFVPAGHCAGEQAVSGDRDERASPFRFWVKLRNRSQFLLQPLPLHRIA